MPITDWQGNPSTSIPDHKTILTAMKVEMNDRKLKPALVNEGGEPVIELRGSYLVDPDGKRHCLGSFFVVWCEVDHERRERDQSST